MPKLYTPRDAAQVLGVNYSTLKQWNYHGKLKSVQTPGGHHRIPESEVDRLLPRIATSGSLQKRRRTFRASAATASGFVQIPLSQVRQHHRRAPDEFCAMAHLSIGT
jgi:excisionase family DNA binding protein